MSLQKLWLCLIFNMLVGFLSSKLDRSFRVDAPRPQIYSNPTCIENDMTPEMWPFDFLTVWLRIALLKAPIIWIFGAFRSMKVHDRASLDTYDSFCKFWTLWLEEPYLCWTMVLFCLPWSSALCFSNATCVISFVSALRTHFLYFLISNESFSLLLCFSWNLWFFMESVFHAFGDSTSYFFFVHFVSVHSTTFLPFC